MAIELLDIKFVFDTEAEKGSGRSTKGQDPGPNAGLGLAPQRAGDAAEAQKEFTLAEKLRGNKKK